MKGSGGAHILFFTVAGLAALALVKMTDDPNHTHKLEVPIWPPKYGQPTSEYWIGDHSLCAWKILSKRGFGARIYIQCWNTETRKVLHQEIRNTPVRELPPYGDNR